MASFWERVLCINDFDTDGGPIDPTFMGHALRLYAQGLATSAWIKGIINTTTSQGADLDALLATQPSTGLLSTLLNAKNVSQWPEKCWAVLQMAQSGYPNFNSVAEMKAALGVP